MYLGEVGRISVAWEGKASCGWAKQRCQCVLQGMYSVKASSLRRIRTENNTSRICASNLETMIIMMQAYPSKNCCLRGVQDTIASFVAVMSPCRTRSFIIDVISTNDLQSFFSSSHCPQRPRLVFLQYRLHLRQPHLRHLC